MLDKIGAGGKTKLGSFWAKFPEIKAASFGLFQTKHCGAYGTYVSFERAQNWRL
jgi:hypothetical protein